MWWIKRTPWQIEALNFSKIISRNHQNRYPKLIRTKALFRLQTQHAMEVLTSKWRYKLGWWSICLDNLENGEERKKNGGEWGRVLFGREWGEERDERDERNGRVGECGFVWSSGYIQVLWPPLDLTRKVLVECGSYKLTLLARVSDFACKGRLDIW